MRIQPGMHGPKLLLPDDHDERARMDDIAVEFAWDGTDTDDEVLVVKLHRHGHTVNAFVLTHREEVTAR